jgi:hypothetical protein
MTIGYRSGATAFSPGTAGTATSITITIPSSVQAGDLLVLGYCMAAATSDPGGQAVIATPTGGGSGAPAWIPMSAQMSLAQVVAQGWYRLAVATDAGTTLTCSYTTDTKDLLQVVALDAWYGVSTVNPVPVINSPVSDNSTSSVTQVTPVINTSSFDQCWIAGMYLGKGTTGATTFTVTPTPNTVRNSVSYPGVAGRPQIAVIDNGTAVSAGPGYGGATITLDQPAAYNCLYTFAIAPATIAGIVRPNVDVTTTGWTPSQSVAGGTPMCSLVSDANDATFVTSTIDPVSQVWQAKLPAMAAPPNTVTNRIFFGGGASNGTVVTTLLQGTTVIATRTDSYSSGGTAPPTTPASLVLTITPTEQSAITNLASLIIECVMTAS